MKLYISGLLSYIIVMCVIILITYRDTRSKIDVFNGISWQKLILISLLSWFGFIFTAGYIARDQNLL